MKKTIKRKHSAVITSDLDYSSETPVQTAIEETQHEVYPCATVLPKTDTTPLEFKIDASNAFVDINNSYLMVQIQILKADGSEMKTKINPKTKTVKSQDIVAPVNNIGYSLFDNCDLYLSGQRITETDNAYPWWTYVYNLLYKTPLEKKTLMRSDCWFEDTAGLFDSVPSKPDAAGNEGFRKRMEIFNDSAKVTLLVPIMLNKRIDHFLPPQTEVMLRFSRAPINLSLQAKKDSEYKIKIWDARLFVKRIGLADSALRQIGSSSNYNFNLESCYTKMKTVRAGDQNIDWVPFTGALPKRIIFWQITRAAHNAKIEQNMYNFQSFGINNFQCFKNGTNLPLSTGFMNIQDDNYQKLYQFSLKALNSPTCYNIEQGDWCYGYMIIIIDLSADGNSTSPSYKNKVQSGTLHLKINYETPLPEAVTLFCLGEYTEELTINGHTRQPLLITDGT